MRRDMCDNACSGMKSLLAFTTPESSLQVVLALLEVFSAQEGEFRQLWKSFKEVTIQSSLLGSSLTGWGSVPKSSQGKLLVGFSASPSMVEDLGTAHCHK